MISGATDAGDVDLDPEESGSMNVEVPAASVQGSPSRLAMYGKMGIDYRDSSKG